MSCATRQQGVSEAASAVDDCGLYFEDHVSQESSLMKNICANWRPRSSFFRRSNSALGEKTLMKLPRISPRLLPGGHVFERHSIAVRIVAKSVLQALRRGHLP